MSRRDEFTPEAEGIPFDPTGSSLTSEEVGPALRELSNTVATSASPGFSFGRSSNVNTGTWLQCETVPSNKAGRFVYITNANIETIFISSENVSTFDLQIYSHDGDEVNLTLISTHSVVSARGGSFVVNQSVATNKQLAVKLSSGSARNLVCGLELSGTN